MARNCSNRARLEDEGVPAVGEDRQRVVRADVDGRRAGRVSMGRSVSELTLSKRLDVAWLYVDSVMNADAVGGFVVCEFELTVLPAPAGVALEYE